MPTTKKASVMATISEDGRLSFGSKIQLIGLSTTLKSPTKNFEAVENEMPLKKKGGTRIRKEPTKAVCRRNERERNRVKQVNLSFDRLRNHVPPAAKNKKLSKMDTLRAAVNYIKYLKCLLDPSVSEKHDFNELQDIDFENPFMLNSDFDSCNFDESKEGMEECEDLNSLTTAELKTNWGEITVSSPQEQCNNALWLQENSAQLQTYSTSISDSSVQVSGGQVSVGQNGLPLQIELGQCENSFEKPTTIFSPTENFTIMSPIASYALDNAQNISQTTNMVTQNILSPLPQGISGMSFNVPQHLELSQNFMTTSPAITQVQSPVITMSPPNITLSSPNITNISSNITTLSPELYCPQLSLMGSPNGVQNFVTDNNISYINNINNIPSPITNNFGPMDMQLQSALIANSHNINPAFIVIPENNIEYGITTQSVSAVQSASFTSKETSLPFSFQSLISEDCDLPLFDYYKSTISSSNNEMDWNIKFGDDYSELHQKCDINGNESRVKECLKELTAWLMQ